MDLFVIDVSLKDGRGHVVLADQAHDPATTRMVTLAFPLPDVPDGPYTDREAQILVDAERVLRAAGLALMAR